MLREPTLLRGALNAHYGIDALAAQFRAIVLVCGYRHSGTTIVSQILATSPEVYSAYDELRVFRTNRPLVSRRNLADFLKEAGRSGRPVALEKTPRSISAVPTALSILPDLRVVIPVRDGRDAVASNIVRGFPYEKAFNRWLAAMDMVERLMRRPQVLVYNHEALVARPGETVRRICDHAGIGYCDDLLAYHETPRNWFRQDEVRRGDGTTKSEHNALRNWQVNQPLFDSSGKWKDVLSDWQLSNFATGEAARLMRRFGYDPAS